MEGEGPNALRWGGKLPPLDELGDIACGVCEEAKCAVCGHEPCPCCVDCCDHPDCLVDAPQLGENALDKTHDCRFTPCERHR